ncbi:SAF domain-containing protein [Bifidobacterium sp. MA2]|uniref:SAF domain-containing protein n=1 Tax=Bifidobacterium santillanense TaxID=2809028 RepID=A0ABS5URV7_9BIFI|nr:SAF domain-containing protein [Bifidobacterium santillanense]MBT1173707.1 SAF domain-containing protein [Bifidobacterium santillanense]
MTKNTTPPWARVMRPTLSGRRIRARLVRLAAALIAGLAVFVTLSSIGAMTATTSVVVASRDIARGSVIRRRDVTMVEVPASAATETALTAIDDVVGSVAQIDIGEHQPMYPSLTRDAPVIPPGRSALELKVSNDVSDLLPGDVISLVSAVGCAPAETAEHLGEVGGEEKEGLCTLTNQALVMGRPATSDSGVVTIEVAVEPDAALRVMNSADVGAVVAVQQ